MTSKIESMLTSWHHGNFQGDYLLKIVLSSFVRGRWEWRSSQVTYSSYHQYLHPMPLTSPTHLATVFTTFAAWTTLLCFKSPWMWMRTRKGVSPQRFNNKRWGDRGRMSIEWKARRQGDPTGQGAAQQSKGRTQTLTDDPGKETKLQGPAKYQGPWGAGGMDAWQIRILGKHVALQVAPAKTPGVCLSNPHYQWSNQSGRSCAFRRASARWEKAGRGRAWWQEECKWKRRIGFCPQATIIAYVEE